MAHLRKRSDSWQICVEGGYDPVTGKHKRIYETINGTKKEAGKRMHELAHEVETGQYIEPSKLTLKEFLHEWFEDYCENNLVQPTQDYYDIIINSHIVPILGNIKLSDLQPMHIKRYLSHKLKDGRLDGKSGGLSKKSVKRHYTTLNRALKHAVQWQIIESNPAGPISPPTPKKPEIQALTEEQLNELLDIAERKPAAVW